jgi:protein LTV1
MVLVPMDPPNMKRGEQSIYSASSIYSGVRRSRVEQEVEAPDLAKERAHDFDDESLEDDSASDEDYDADDNDGQYDDVDDEEEQRMRKKGIYHMGDIVDPDYSHKTYLLSSYGVDNRDNYDYEQHLREIGKGTFVEAEGPDEVPKADAAAATVALGKLTLGFEGQHALQLPTEVFASGKEQAVGLMNLEAPTGLDLSVDPDIVRALETFSSDEADELEDNFIFLANASGDDEDGDGDEDEDDLPSLDSLSAVGSEDGGAIYYASQQDGDQDHGTSSHATRNQHKASAMVQRTLAKSMASVSQASDYTHKSVLEEINEYKLEEQLNRGAWSDIGSGEEDVGDQEADLQRYGDIFDEFLEQQQQNAEEESFLLGAHQRANGASYQAMILAAAERQAAREPRHPTIDNDHANGASDLDGSDSSDAEAGHDCMTVLTSLSNTSYIPRVIAPPPAAKMIALSRRTGIPLGVLEAQKKERRQRRRDALEAEEAEEAELGEPDLEEAESMVEVVNKGAKRGVSESAEEKKARKAAVKEERRARREQKKERKLAFSRESVAAARVAAHQPKQSIRPLP